MTPEQLERLETTLRSAVAEQVKITVNGRIEKMNDKLDQHLADHTAKYNDFIKWRDEEIKPMAEVFKVRTGISKWIMTFLVGAGATGGFCAGVAEIINLFHKS